MTDVATPGQPSFPRRGPWALVHDQSVLWLAWLILVVCVTLLNSQYENRINPDATAYFSLAQKWARGAWLDGISGHWSPLFIWLIALGSKLGLSNITAVAIIDTMAGCVLLWSANRLICTSPLSNISRTILLAAISLYALYFTFAAITPDLLMAALLTSYLALSAEAPQTVRGLCMTGAVAGLAYLAKPIALDFVLVHYCITQMIGNRGVKAPWTKILSNIGVVTGTMFLVAAPWVGCLWVKYHRFTLGTAGNNLLREMAPPFRAGGVVNIGLGAMPNPTASNYWEHPDQLNLPAWSPLDSTYFSYFLDYVETNAVVLIVTLSLISVLALPILFYAVFRWWRGNTDPVVKSLVLAPLILSPVYCLFVITDRYLLPVVVWILVLAARLIPPGRRSALVLSLVSLSFFPYAILGLNDERHQGDAERQIARSLSARLQLNGNAASLAHWSRSLYVCYYAGLPYFGTPAASAPEGVLQELQRFHIRYFLVWRSDKIQSGLLGQMRLVTDNGVPPELKIYEVPIPAASAATSSALNRTLPIQQPRLLQNPPDFLRRRGLADEKPNLQARER